jgi:hypothetical protein
LLVVVGTCTRALEGSVAVTLPLLCQPGPEIVSCCRRPAEAAQWAT